MGLFDKIKDIFYEEEDEEIKEPKKEEKIEEEQKEKEPTSVLSERDMFKTDPKFKFPINFGEEDIVEKDETKVNVLEEQQSKYMIIENKTTTEETKIFRPSPVLSPIYGILDKNYKKGDIVEKNSVNGAELDGKIDVDSVMQKAYGQVEVSRTVTREETKYIPIEEPISREAEINLFETLKEDAIQEKEEQSMSRVEQNESDYEEESYDLDEIDDKIKSIDKLLKDTTDDDFYSLVDSMYKDEVDEE